MKVSKKLPAFMGNTILQALNAACGSSYNNEKLQSLHENLRDTLRSTNGFVSIFNAEEPRVKFANVQGVALAITTGMVKEVIHDTLSRNAGVGGDQQFLFVLMDVVIYMEEVGLNALEFPVTKTKFFRDISRHEEWIPLSDRYQTDSWKKRLKMSYPSYDTSGGQLYPESVTLAEANRL